MINKLSPIDIICRMIGGLLYYSPKIVEEVNDYMFEFQPSQISPNLTLLYIYKKYSLVDQLSIILPKEDLYNITVSHFENTCFFARKVSPTGLQLQIKDNSSIELLNLISLGEHSIHRINKI